MSPPLLAAAAAHCRCRRPAAALVLKRAPSLVPRPPLAVPRPQCQGVLPVDTLPDGSKPVQRWGHYQYWWQTIMTKAAPELRGMGWTNLK